MLLLLLVYADNAYNCLRICKGVLFFFCFVLFCFVFSRLSTARGTELRHSKKKKARNTNKKKKNRISYGLWISLYILIYTIKLVDHKNSLKNTLVKMH